MRKPGINVLVCLFVGSLAVSLGAGPAAADVYSVDWGTHQFFQYPQPNPSAPYQNPSPIGTGGRFGFQMFNPTTGFLTQVDLAFSYSTGYTGMLRNSSSTAFYEGWFQDTGSKTARFIVHPFGTLWTHNSPSEGRSAADYVPRYSTSWYLDSPTRSYSSGVYSITNPNDVRLFVGIGQETGMIEAHIHGSYSFTTSASALSVLLWQRMYAPRGTITYHYNPFAPDPVEGGAGLSFSLAEGPSYGQGQVEPTPLGASHAHRVQASGGQGAVTENTGYVQRFRFQREDQGSQQTSVFINGLLDGFLSADDNGLAQALGVMELYNDEGELVERTERLAFADSQVYFGRLEEKDVHERFGMTVMLLPGEVYELRTELHVTADPRGAGTALADFANTFEVEVSGVPEPASLALFAAGALALLRRRRRA
jgi:hypothetical protein